MANPLIIAQLVATLVPQLLGLVTQAIAAGSAGDQASLDTLHNQAIAAANALKPISS
jgi:hypothetical protein